MKEFITICIVLISNIGYSQGPYAGPVDSANTTAVHMDSSIISSWAISCELKRGFLNIKDTSLGKPIVGVDSMATGKALSKGVISLGDKGMATLTFEGLIYNGPGPDFAVFENAFDDNFLELAFVEVSSDGQNYYRFPAFSETDTSQQVKSYDSLKTTNIHNLAGKYRMGFGTPFDLEDLNNTMGLDINHISHVRIVDVGGTIDSELASRDSRGYIINDPYPTPWPNGGFDLDAVAAIHIQPTGIEEKKWADNIEIFPNPTSSVVKIRNVIHFKSILYNSIGKEVSIGQESEIDLSGFPSGIYYLRISTKQFSTIKKIIKR